MAFQHCTQNNFRLIFLLYRNFDCLIVAIFMQITYSVCFLRNFGLFLDHFWWLGFNCLFFCYLTREYLVAYKSNGYHLTEAHWIFASVSGSEIPDSSKAMDCQLVFRSGCPSASFKGISISATHIIIMPTNLGHRSYLPNVEIAVDCHCEAISIDSASN